MSPWGMRGGGGTLHGGERRGRGDRSLVIGRGWDARPLCRLTTRRAPISCHAAGYPTCRLHCSSWLYLGVAVVNLSATPKPCIAQASMFGRVVDSVTHARVGLATVALLDTTGKVVVSVRADSTGYFELKAGPGRYRWRVERAGYRPHISRVFDMKPGRVGMEFALAPIAKSERHPDGVPSPPPHRSR
jgi:hypothetical protein